jgi:sRNA-binding protein
MTTHNITLPREALVELVEYLAATYPKAFFTRSHQKQPLKKNIVADLERDRVLDDDKRGAAISYYTRDWAYENCLLVPSASISTAKRKQQMI